ncbi:hypothetical protein NPIL_406041, partial [Nephila pilipes]
ILVYDNFVDLVACVAVTAGKVRNTVGVLKNVWAISRRRYEAYMDALVDAVLIFFDLYVVERITFVDVH